MDRDEMAFLSWDDRRLVGQPDLAIQPPATCFYGDIKMSMKFSSKPTMLGHSTDWDHFEYLTAYCLHQHLRIYSSLR